MTQKLGSPGIATSYKATSGGRIIPAPLGTGFFTIIAQKGEIGKPLTILNPTDAQAQLGDYIAGYYGRKAIDVAFGEGLKKAIVVRTAHYTAGVLDAVKSALTMKGFNPLLINRPKVDTLTFTSKSEGLLGDRLNVVTERDSTVTTADTQDTGGDETPFLTVADSSVFTVGDVIDIVGVTNTVRTIVTKIHTATQINIAIIPATPTIVSGATVKTASNHLVKTVLTADLVTNATSADLASVTNVSIGQIISITDENSRAVTVKVTGISGNKILFADIGTLATSIVVADSAVVSQEFQATIYDETVQVGEVQKYLSMSPIFEKNYVNKKFKNSELTIIDVISTEDHIGDLPEALSATYLAGGDDGLVGLTDTDFIGSSALKNGLYAFDSLQPQFGQIGCFDARSGDVVNATQNYAEKKLWWFESQPDFDKTPQEAIDFKSDDALMNSDKAAMSYPNCEWLNPITGVQEDMPAAGFIMGLNSRIWNTVGKGPWIQPAGVEDGVLTTCKGLESDYTQDSDYRDLLSPALLNSIYKDNNYGFIIYDINTLGVGAELSQKGESVTFLYARHSIQNGVPWATFKNIDDALYSRVRRTVKTFLRGMRVAGGLKGLTDEEAFVIDLDSLNTPETEEAGEFWTRIGLATKKGARFVYFEFSKKINQAG